MSGPADPHFDDNAKRLSVLYESAKFERVHDYLLRHLPAAPAKVLDIGAGSGRDAAALAAMGHQVTAAEPSPAMMREARANHPTARISWVQTGLPELQGIEEKEFDLVLLSAVWMFIPPEDRAEAVERIREVCHPAGIVALSLRQSTSDESGTFQASDVNSTQGLFERGGFRLLETGEQADTLGRKQKSWTTLVFMKNR